MARTVKNKDVGRKRSRLEEQGKLETIGRKQSTLDNGPEEKHAGATMKAKELK